MLVSPVGSLIAIEEEAKLGVISTPPFAVRAAPNPIAPDPCKVTEPVVPAVTGAVVETVPCPL